MKTWTDATGKKAPLFELEHSHLKNIIKYLWRLNDWLKPKTDKLGLDVNLESKPMCILYLNYVLYTHEFADSKIQNYTFQLNGDIAQDWNDMNEELHSEELESNFFNL
jgi:hypothetical protein